jgi:alkylation response protein AidB-like acyl-CoA dehydrogenase
VDLTLSPDQEALAESAAAFVERSCPTERVRKIEASDDSFDADLWAAMAALDWMGLVLPESMGGVGQGMTELAVLCEELGRGPVPSPLVTSTTLAALPILWAGSQEQRERWLPALARGAVVGSAAMVDGDVLVPYASVASVVVVVTDDGLGLVESGPALSWRRHRSFAGDPLFAVTVGPGGIERLAGEAEPDVVARARDHAAVAHLAYCVGCAETALALSVAHARDREQFGRPIGSFQAVAHRCVDMRTDIDACRVLAHQAAWALDRGDGALEVAAALAYASDALRRVFLNAHQVHGAIGFSTEHDLHLYTRRAKAFELSCGGASHHRERLAAAMGLG